MTHEIMSKTMGEALTVGVPKASDVPTACAVIWLNVPPGVCTVAVVPIVVPRTLKVPPATVVVPGFGVLGLRSCALTAVGFPPETLMTWPVSCPLGFVAVGIWTMGFPLPGVVPIRLGSLRLASISAARAEITRTAIQAAVKPIRCIEKFLRGQIV